MKNVVYLVMFLLGIALTANSNEPTSIDGTYITTKTYNYDFDKKIWEDIGDVNHKLHLNTLQGVVEFRHQKFTITKYKEKLYKKTGALEYKLTLLDENGQVSLAILLILPDQKINEIVYQFYLSNDQLEASFDLKQ